MEQSQHPTSRRGDSAVRRVLFVDPDRDVTRGLAIAMRREGWEIHLAHSREEVLERIGACACDVIVCDEALSEVFADQCSDPLAPSRILLSTERKIESAVLAVNRGDIYRFLFKPCSAEEIALTIHHAMEARDIARRIERWTEEQVRERMALEFEFDRALEKLWMGFQPILSPDGSVTGYEALVRTDHAEFRTPARIFAAALALGRSIELGERIRAAIADRIHEAPPSAIFFVNVHPDDLGRSDLFDPNAPLGAYADRVVLEIGQRTALSTTDRARPEIERLRQLGYRIAIDDLGAGYSGLESFAGMQPDFVKLDRAIIRDIDRLPTQRAIAETVLRICREVDIPTVAEGVETEEEWAATLEMGCGFVQGFLFREVTPDFVLEPVADLPRAV